MDTPNVLWFFGAFAIAFASTAVLDKVPESSRDVWVLLAALGFFAAYALAAWLLLRRWWWVPGGLAATLAVAMVPAIGFGVASLVGTFPHDPFFDPTQDFSWSVFLIGLATVVVGLLAFALTRFSFALFTVVTAVLITAQFFVPAIDDDPGADAHAVTAIVAGAALVLIGLALDAVRRRRDAFWFHVGGFFSVAVALIYYAANVAGDTNRGWVPMVIAGGIVLLFAAPLRRATWALYGVLGFYAPIFHWLTSGIDADSVGYALILLAIGISIFLLGLIVHRFGRLWLDRRRSAAPPLNPAADV